MDVTKLETTIKETLQHKDLNLDLPPVEFIAMASRIVAKSKAGINTNNDFFYLIARFLNMKIKLYQVIIVLVATFSLYFYSQQSRTAITKHSTTTGSQRINTSVNSYTVMASIKQTKII